MKHNQRKVLKKIEEVRSSDSDLAAQTEIGQQKYESSEVLDLLRNQKFFRSSDAIVKTLPLSIPVRTSAAQSFTEHKLHV